MQEVSRDHRDDTVSMIPKFIPEISLKSKNLCCTGGKDGIVNMVSPGFHETVAYFQPQAFYSVILDREF